MYHSYSSAFGKWQADPDVWYIFPRDASLGIVESSYVVKPGQEQVLGIYDLMDRDHPDGVNQPVLSRQEEIAVEQCAVEIAHDGTYAILHALGTQPTGYRSGPNVYWTWLQPGQSIRMEHYWKISLDVNSPEEAVFKLGDGYLLRQEETRKWEQQKREQQERD